jgi:hypothetical protein
LEFRLDTVGTLVNGALAELHVAPERNSLVQWLRP